MFRRAITRRTMGCSMGAVQSRGNASMSIEELQDTIKKIGKSGESSKGMEQLKNALAMLQEEVEEKKRNKEKKEFNYYIVHTTGPERLGMLAQVASIVSDNGMEILASRATLLGGDFSMMIHIRTTERKAAEKMKEELLAIPDVKTWVHDASSTTDDSNTVGPGRVAKVLRITGENSPGIISSITKYLQKRNAFIMNMASEMAAAPLGGPPMFQLRLVLDTPGDLGKEEVVAGLNAVAATIGAKMKIDSFVHCHEAE
eukprot:TRINITY_DN4334_c0_g4_i1.p1 TRINITY_DN4334_c0_g4~~TRINITY_DN4334_c0_g4_i1.p1  ORF type:complete len:257 (+),score=63.15 TRINITY_DN4334_c0_g4_i1:47-817(+)